MDGILIKVVNTSGWAWQQFANNTSGSIWTQENNITYTCAVFLTIFQTYLIKHKIYSMHMSAYHKGVVFIIAPVQDSKGSGRFLVHLFKSCTASS